MQKSLSNQITDLIFKLTDEATSYVNNQSKPSSVSYRKNGKRIEFEGYNFEDACGKMILHLKKEYPSEIDNAIAEINK
jgi:hypothetical protein